VLDRVGSGRWTRVFRARPVEGPTGAPADYAIKLLAERHESEERLVSLMRKEATVGRQVSHRHLISVLSAHVHARPYYVVMPLLSGATLAARLAAGWRPTLNTALWVARQTAEALEALHSAGWRHGDVKPSNIFVSPEGHVTLIDLGFVQPIFSAQSLDEPLMGTPDYLAPELLSTRPSADGRSDLFSLGVVLFEMLAGCLPWQARTPEELIDERQLLAAPNVREFAPQTPTEIAFLLRMLLSKEPVRRPHSARDLVRQLVRYELRAMTG
jgi:serine/threonine-protein kinase